MNYQFLVTLVLCLGILVAWQRLYRASILFAVDSSRVAEASTVVPSTSSHQISRKASGIMEAASTPLIRLMDALERHLHNYGFAIIALTALLKIATFPLVYKSSKTMRKVAKLQPELLKIRERHKDDPTRMRLELMEYMRRSGYNPLAGVLSFLAQIPIYLSFFFLYSVIRGADQLHHAPFVLWITDLSRCDPYFVVPALYAVFALVHQRVSARRTPSHQRSDGPMRWIPIGFAAATATLPVGVGLYLLTNISLSVLQELVIARLTS